MLNVGAICICLASYTTASASGSPYLESIPETIRPNDANDDAAKEAEEQAKKTREAAEKAAKEAREAADKAVKETREAAQKIDKESREAAEKAAKEAREAAEKAIDAAQKAVKEAREAAKEASEAGSKAEKEVREAAEKAAKEAREAAVKTRDAAQKAAADIAKIVHEDNPSEAAKKIREATLTATKEAREATLTAAKEAREAAKKSEVVLAELELSERKFDLISDKVEATKDRLAQATTSAEEKSLLKLLSQLQKSQLNVANEYAKDTYQLLRRSAEAAYEQDKRTAALDYQSELFAAIKISDQAARKTAITAAKAKRDERKVESRKSFRTTTAEARKYLGQPQVVTLVAPDTVFETATTFIVEASSTSGLTVTVSSDSPTICSVTGNTVSIIQAGRCVLSATQLGSDKFSPAQTASLVVTVNAVTTDTTTTTTVAPTTTVAKP